MFARFLGRSAEHDPGEMVGHREDDRLLREPFVRHLGELGGCCCEAARDGDEEDPREDLLLDAADGLGVEEALAEVRAGEQLVVLLDAPASRAGVGDRVGGERSRPNAFVHRTHAPGETMKVDFDRSFARLCGVERQIHLLERHGYRTRAAVGRALRAKKAA